MTTLDALTQAILRHYPRVYVACHIDHQARRDQGPQISARDQTILSHVSDTGLRPQALAQHLGIAASPMSAALKLLTAMDLVKLTPDAGDARGKVVRLTSAGKTALTKTSVLDVSRVRAALTHLDPADRVLAVRGMALLADAAQVVGKEN